MSSMLSMPCMFTCLFVFTLYLGTDTTRFKAKSVLTDSINKHLIIRHPNRLYCPYA